MFNHQKIAHPSKTPALVNPTNRERCGLCEMVTAKEHFANYHRTIFGRNISNPFHVGDDILKEILLIDIHKALECGHCDMEFQTNDEFQHHHTMQHSTLQPIGNAKPNAAGWQYECCDMLFSENEYLKHLEWHSCELDCGECAFRTGILTELVEHDAIAHNSRDKRMANRSSNGSSEGDGSLRCIEFMKQLKGMHAMNKVIFGNGLVLSNFNLKGTKCDESLKFEEAFNVLERRLKKQILQMNVDKYEKAQKAQRKQNETRNKSNKDKDKDKFNDIPSRLHVEDKHSNGPSISGNRRKHSHRSMAEKERRKENSEENRLSRRRKNSKLEISSKSKMKSNANTSTTIKNRSKIVQKVAKKNEKYLKMYSTTDDDSDFDTFSMSSEASSISNSSFGSCATFTSSRPVQSRSMLYAELRKQNELVNNLSISGIPMRRNENLMKIFDKLCVKLNVPVSQNDVKKIFRLSSHRNQIIVKLKTWTAKEKIKRYFNYKNVWSSDLVVLPSHVQPTKIFINAHTTRFYGKMIQIAEYYKKIGLIRSFYLCENGLFVRSYNCERDYAILSKEELIDWIRMVEARADQRHSTLKRSRLHHEFDDRRLKRRRN